MLARGIEERVLKFCAAQRRGPFSTNEWLRMAGVVVEPELAVVALFLAGGDWYGHQVELESVAEQLLPGCVGHFAELAKHTRFECSRFGNMLKMELGLK